MTPSYVQENTVTLEMIGTKTDSVHRSQGNTCTVSFLRIRGFTRVLGYQIPQKSIEVANRLLSETIDDTVTVEVPTPCLSLYSIVSAREMTMFIV